MPKKDLIEHVDSVLCPIRDGYYQCTITTKMGKEYTENDIESIYAFQSPQVTSSPTGLKISHLEYHGRISCKRWLDYLYCGPKSAISSMD